MSFWRRLRRTLGLAVLSPIDIVCWAVWWACMPESPSWGVIWMVAFLPMRWVSIKLNDLALSDG